MKNKTFALVAAALCAGCSCTCRQDAAVSAKSPDGRSEIRLLTNPLSYEVLRDGKVVSGRDNTETDVSKVVGLFINSIPLRLKTEEMTTGREALRSLQQQAAASSAHDFCMLAETMEAAGLENGLLGTVMAFENYSSGRREDPLAAALPMTPFCMKEEIFDAMHTI